MRKSKTLQNPVVKVVLLREVAEAKLSAPTTTRPSPSPTPASPSPSVSGTRPASWTSTSTSSSTSSNPNNSTFQQTDVDMNPTLADLVSWKHICGRVSKTCQYRSEKNSNHRKTKHRNHTKKGQIIAYN
jgi:hypothetical protein